MATGYSDGAADGQYLMASDMNAGMYDGTSSESSASSPMNCNVCPWLGEPKSKAATDFRRVMIFRTVQMHTYHIHHIQCNTPRLPWA